MSKVLSTVLPMAAGFLIGGPIGTAIGGELGVGAGIGTDIASTIGGALVGGGTSALMGNGFLGGALGGAGGGLISGVGGAQGIMSALSGSGGAAGPMSVVSGASDPIEALNNAMTITGTSTATDAATALGFPSTNAMLTAANPNWLTTGAAFQGAQANATGGLLGGAKAPQIGSFTGTAGSVGGQQANNASLLAALSAKGGAGLGTLSTLGSLASGIYGLTEAQQMQQLASQMASSNTYSPQASAQLSALLANPNSITSMPGYQAGMTAVERSMAAQGYQGSGNMAAALQQYGGNFYNQQVSQLQGLAQGGASTTGGAANAQALAGSAASSALASLGYGATSLGF